jgi:ACS family glucarate transporter-like MFS transporter
MEMRNRTTLEPTKASRIRFSIIALALLIDMMAYLDRVCISVGAPKISAEFGLSRTEMGVVFGMFSLAYCLFQPFWGALADRYGSRLSVAVGILWWSLFTGLTAAAGGLASLLVIRFLFGVGEAALSPSIASAYARWIPTAERSTAFGAFLSGGRIGGALAPPIAAFLLIHFGWRRMFPAFSGIGLVFAVAWWFWYRNDPGQHPRVNAAELKVIVAGTAVRNEAVDSAAIGLTWRRLIFARRLMLLLAVVFSYTFMWQFYVTWFPTYLMDSRGFNLHEVGQYASLPFVAGLVANWVGGLITDILTRRIGPRLARRWVGFAALIGSAILLYLGISTANRKAAALLMALAPGAGDMALAVYWSSAVAIGGRAAGAVAGLMNSASSVGSFFSPISFGWAFHRWQNWNAILLAAVASDVVAAILWLGVTADQAENTL